MSMKGDESLSLYLHIPFCQHRCSYCDFNTYTGLSDLQDDYAEALMQEIEQVAKESSWHAKTIFFGGGTPSLMSPNSLAAILRALGENFKLADEAEITLEANPETVDFNYLSEIQGLGINRISYGAQSANPQELTLMERKHDFNTVSVAMEMARAAGFDNISLDLIYGLPDQGLDSWEMTLHAALALNPDHLSLYCLTIEPGTPMYKWLKNGRINPPIPDMAAEQFELAGAILAKKGFVHYEISNWALPNQECRHNLTYWRNDTYLGFGAGAHGHAAGFRYWNVKQPRVYLRRINHHEKHPFPMSGAVAGYDRLTKKQTMSDTIITQLRLLEEGLDLNAFKKKFGLRIDEAYPKAFDELIDLGLLKVNKERLLLSEKGRFLSNQVFYRFM